MYTVNVPTSFPVLLPSINCPVRRNIFWARFVSILNNNLCKSHLYFSSSTPRLCNRRGADDLARVGCINRAAGKPWRYPWSFSYLRLFGEGKRRNEFAEWHVAWLAEWHNYAEFNNLRKIAQKKKIHQESMRSSLPRLLWRQFERAIDLLVHLLLLLKQGYNWNTADIRILDKSSITRFQNKLKRFFTQVSFPEWSALKVGKHVKFKQSPSEYLLSSLHSKTS